MTQYTWCASLLLAGCAAAMSITNPGKPGLSVHTRRKPIDDTFAMATGYIYRKDGNKPAMFLKLGAVGAGQSDADSDARRSSRYDKSPAYRRPSNDYRGGKDGYEFQQFGGLDVSQMGQSEDSPYGSEHSDSPAGILEGGHFSPDSGIEDHLEGIDGVDTKRGTYLGSSGPLDGLGDVGDEYLAVHGTNDHFSSPKATRTKHDADDFVGLKTIGDEYSSPIKLGPSEDYPSGSHADYHHSWGGHGGGGHGGGGGGGGGKNSAKGGGNRHSSHSFSVHGTKAGKGHKNTKSYGGGEHGSHGSEAHKGTFSGGGATKKEHHDETGKYGSHHANTKGTAGGKQGEKGHGKKGHKATGFHNVYNKDEFKKDTAFYDTNDKGGTHHKGGDHASTSSGKSGSHKKGGFHGSGYIEGHKGKTAHSDQGKTQKDHKSNKGGANVESVFSNKETYGKKDAFGSGKKFSHSSKGGGHH